MTEEEGRLQTLIALVEKTTAALVELKASIEGLRRDLRDARSKEHWHDG
jgi:hypothetical protein